MMHQKARYLGAQLSLLILACCWSSWLMPATEASGNSHRCREGDDDWYQFNGKCYLLSKITEGWFGAQKHCESISASQVSIGSRAENRFLHALADCGSNFWIGMVKTDVRQRGFTWWDDSHNNYTEMLSIRTTDYYDCVYFESGNGGRWFNYICQALNHFVCVTPAITAEAAAVEENNAAHSADPSSAAEDVDAKSKCPDDWLSLEHNCYFVSSEKTNYFNAQMACEAKAATVASVVSAREQKLLTMALGCGTEAWIGLEKIRPCISNPSQQFCWTWMNRSPLGYSAWHSGFPSNTKEVECVITDGRWKTMNCYNDHRYICKKN